MDDGNTMNETWSQLSSDDVLGEFLPAEKAMLNNIRGAEDTLADICVRIIAEIRKAYSDGGRQVDTTDGTIPDGDKAKAIAIARWKLLTSFPRLKVYQTAEREQACKDAESYFLEVAKRVVSPSGGAEIVSKQERRATRSKLDGLI